MIHTTILLLISIWSSSLSSTQIRTTEELFSTLRDSARLGQFPTDDQLLELGFRRSADVGLELNSEAGRLYVMISGPNRNAFTMTWSPKEPSPTLHESVLSALISRSAHIELMGRDRMKVVINEPNDGPAAFREGFIVGVVDGKLHSTIVEAFSR